MEKEMTEKNTKTVTNTETNSNSQPKAKGAKLPLPAVIAIGCVGLLVVSGIIMSIVTKVFLSKIGSTIVQKGIENRTGLKVDTSKGKEGLSITDQKTGAKVNLGAQEIPQDFPKDFPIYPGSKPTGSLSGGNKKEQGFWMMLTTSDDYSKVEAYYTNALQKSGWSTEETIRIGNSVTWKVGKDAYEGSVMVSQEKADKETGILIILGLNNQNQNNTEGNIPPSTEEPNIPSGE
jgi:hypothetical protein